MARAEIRAYAKVNLALALARPEPAGSPRAGWHRICTWMCAIDLADDVLVESLGEGSASTWSASWERDALRRGVVDWPVERDLAWRALRALEGRVGRRLPTRIVLRKRIPAGAGLGGGSADAAAALVGIDRVWGLGLGLAALRELGATLGSDVPFFLDERAPARPAVVSGFGETLERTAPAQGEIVLISPAVSCPTGAVYRAFDGLDHAGMREREVRALARGAAATGGLFNDLAEAAVRARPELAGLREAAARATGRPVHVTGSGSALFIACGVGEGASLVDRLGAAALGAAVRVCALL